MVWDWKGLGLRCVIDFVLVGRTVFLEWFVGWLWVRFWVCGGFLQAGLGLGCCGVRYGDRMMV